MGKGNVLECGLCRERVATSLDFKSFQIWQRKTSRQLHKFKYNFQPFNSKLTFISWRFFVRKPINLLRCMGKVRITHVMPLVSLKYQCHFNAAYLHVGIFNKEFCSHIAFYYSIASFGQSDSPFIILFSIHLDGSQLADILPEISSNFFNKYLHLFEWLHLIHNSLL